ncbi:MAG: isoamylase early set domain-containing protein [Chloroflexota bacterium]
MLTKKYLKTAEECEVTFELEREGVQEAALVCETNEWRPVAMKQPKKGGAFRAKVRLPKNGQFQFRYLLDGNVWENDEAADAYWPNEFGSDNSVVDTTPSQN